MVNITVNNGVVVCDKYIILNGTKYEIPDYIKGNNQTVINGKIFIGGYEFKYGKFKKTLRALWYKWF